MRWKLKAAIQNTISFLPSSASYEVYYWIQRHLGALRQINPISRLSGAIETWQRITKQGYDPSGKIFFEIGTGRAPLVPLAFWLMGAEKTITVDLNPYLKEELIKESLQFIKTHRGRIEKLFGNFLDEKRFQSLLAFAETDFTLQEFLGLCHITYIAPGDAANTGLPPQSIDFHTSYTVLEHIHPEVLTQIIKEGRRLISDTGLFVHFIDYSDHFAYSDNKISAINFLQYSDKEWDGYARNRYMYTNRLRHDDFLNLFESEGLHILDVEEHTNVWVQSLLKDGTLNINEKFSAKPKEILAVTNAWIVSKLAHREPVSWQNQK